MVITNDGYKVVALLKRNKSMKTIYEQTYMDDNINKSEALKR